MHVYKHIHPTTLEFKGPFPFQLIYLWALLLLIKMVGRQFESYGFLMAFFPFQIKHFSFNLHDTHSPFCQTLGEE